MIHLSVLAGMTLGWWYPKLLVMALLAWFIKMVVEFPMVRWMSRFFGKGSQMGYYIPAQIFQLIYLPVVGILGLIIPYRWKGRKG